MADHSQSDIELVHSALRPLLMMLGDFRNLTPTLLLRLTHMIELFPTSFNEKMCNSLLVSLSLSLSLSLFFDSIFAHVQSCTVESRNYIPPPFLRASIGKTVERDDDISV
jgi:hypothetical protein